VTVRVTPGGGNRGVGGGRGVPVVAGGGNRGAPGVPVPLKPSPKPGDRGHRRRRSQRPYLYLRAHRHEMFVKLGKGAPVVTAGLGGYVEVPRPFGVSLTEWQGVAPFKLDIPVIFNGFIDGRDVQEEVDDLLWFGTSENDNPPPTFYADGPIPYAGEHMVFEDTPDWGDSYRNARGHLIYQELTLHLMQYVPPDRIKFSKQKGKLPDDVPGTYTSKKGDTLNKISVKFYGDTSRAVELGKINRIRDPRKQIPEGTVIHLLPA
jgi:hypothetical protein